jgi:hypothetical protein
VIGWVRGMTANSETGMLENRGPFIEAIGTFIDEEN